MNGLRMGKHSVRAAQLAVSLLIFLVIAGPILGFLAPEVAPQAPVGFGVNLQAAAPQLEQVFSQSSNLAGTHEIAVPVYNEWFFPAEANLSLTLITSGQVVYRTPPASVNLAPFQSGRLNLTVQLSPSVVGQLQGKQVGVGGEMTLGTGQFWTVTLDFPQG